MRQVEGITRQHGRMLPARLRSKLQPAFRHNLDEIRIHEGANAHTLAADLNAEAFVQGQHIIYGSLQNAWSSERSLALLVHEIAHVNSSSISGNVHLIGAEDSAQELVADATAAAVLQGREAPPMPLASSVTVWRKKRAKPVVKTEAKSAHLIELEAMIKAGEDQAVDDVRRRDADILFDTKDLTLLIDHHARDQVISFFEKRHGNIHEWVQSFPDKQARITGLAILESNLKWPAYARLASATMNQKIIDDPVDILLESQLSGRKEINALYKKVYENISPNKGNLQKDLLVFYRGVTDDFHKCVALLDHDLTKAEELFFAGAGKNEGEGTKLAPIFLEVYKKGGELGLHELDQQWWYYIRLPQHWWRGEPWSYFDLLEAMQKTLGGWFSEEYRVKSFLDIIRKQRKDREELTRVKRPENAWEELQSKLKVLRQQLQLGYKINSYRVRDTEALQKLLRTYHELWKEYIRAVAKVRDQAKITQAENQYAADIDELLRSDVVSADDPETAPFLNTDPQLADELYATLHTGWFGRNFGFPSFAAMEQTITKKWVDDPSITDALWEDARKPRISKQGQVLRKAYDPLQALTSNTSDTSFKRVFALLYKGVNDATQGHYRVMVELNPYEDVWKSIKSQTISKGTDNDLRGTHLFLAASRLDSGRRDEILKRFFELTDAAHFVKATEDVQHPGRAFLSYISAFHPKGANYNKLREALDPATSLDEKYKRALNRYQPGSAVTAAVRRAWEEVNGRDRDASVGASIEAIGAQRDPKKVSKLVKLYGAASADELRSVLDQGFEKRLEDLEAADAAVASTLAKAFETLVDCALSAVLGPAAWLQVLKEVVVSFASIGANEFLQGDKYDAVSRENTKAVIQAAIGSLLFDVVDIRTKIDTHVVNDEDKIFRWIRQDLGHEDVSSRLRSMTQNVMAGVADNSVKFVTAGFLDAAVLHKYPDSEAMSRELSKVFLGALSRSLHGGVITYKENPGALTDLMTIGERFKTNLTFKFFVKGTEGLTGKVVDAAFVDPEYRFAELLQTMAVGFANYLGTILVKTTGSTLGQHREAKLKLARAQIVAGQLERGRRLGHKESALTDTHLVSNLVADDRKTREEKFDKGLKDFLGSNIEKKASAAVDFRDIPKALLDKVAHEDPNVAWSEDRRRVAVQWMQNRLATEVAPKTAVKIEKAYAQAAQLQIGQAPSTVFGAIADRNTKRVGQLEEHWRRNPSLVDRAVRRSIDPKNLTDGGDAERTHWALDQALHNADFAKKIERNIRILQQQ